MNTSWRHFFLEFKSPAMPSIAALTAVEKNPGVPAEVLRPRSTWKNPAEYDAQAHKLASMFIDNFKSFEAEASHDIKAAGPRG